MVPDVGGIVLLAAVVAAVPHIPRWRLDHLPKTMSEDQLRRFLGSGSGRKIRSAPLLVEALDLTRVPRALDRVLAMV